MDRERDRSRRGGLHGNNVNPRHYHTRREFHRSGGNMPIDSNNNSPMFKPMRTWKLLRTRLEELTAEKSNCLSDHQKREEEAMKSHNARHSELLNNERESIREKAKDRDSLKIKEEEFRSEMPLKLALAKELKVEHENQSSIDTRVSVVQTEMVEKEEELRLEKDRILESFMVLEAQFTSQEKKLTKEIFEERESLNREKSDLMEEFATRERNLDSEIHRFCNEVERQSSDLDKKYRFDPVMMRNTILEREIIQRDQAMQQMQSYVAELEERIQIQIEQIQRTDSEYLYQKAQLMNQMEYDKSCIIAKAKSDGILEYLRGEWQGFDAYDPSAFQDPQNPGFPFPYQEDAQAQSPCFQHLKQSNGAILTDLRDRYEDLKVKANAENNEDKFNWTLAMIRKIVSYYESLGMRVYEESASNKYTSTLIWCPNDHLYPNKLEASFAMGHGDTEEEATENAAQLAFYNIQCFATNTVNEDCSPCLVIPTDNFTEQMQPLLDIVSQPRTSTDESNNKGIDNLMNNNDAPKTVDIQSLISLSNAVPVTNEKEPSE